MDNYLDALLLVSYLQRQAIAKAHSRADHDQFGELFGTVSQEQGTETIHTVAGCEAGTVPLY